MQEKFKWLVGLFKTWYGTGAALLAGLTVSGYLSEEYLEQLLSAQSRADLTEKLIIVWIVWAAMGRKVEEKFDALNKKVDLTLSMFQEHLNKVVQEIKEMKSAVVKDLEINHTRLSAVESVTTNLLNRVDRLETKE